VYIKIIVFRNVTLCSLIGTNVSEELVAASSCTLKMEAASPSETLVQTQRGIPKDGNLHSYRCGNFKCHSTHTANQCNCGTVLFKSSSWRRDVNDVSCPVKNCQRGGTEEDATLSPWNRMLARRKLTTVGAPVIVVVLLKGKSALLSQPALRE
jgi:hypothetical protein